MLRTIIIDDEKHQQLNLEKMVKLYCHGLEVVEKANDLTTAERAIREHKPDLVLLDIHLGDGSGFDLLSRFTPVFFKVIFVTAFDHFAIKAFRYNALDYLLKPVDPDELCQAARKAAETIQPDFNLQLENLRSYIHAEGQTHSKIILKTSDTIHVVSVQEILYCESESNYTHFRLTGNRNIMVSATLKEYEDILVESGFFRVHKSFLINLARISRFEKAEGGSVVLEGEKKIPVASRKRDELIHLIEQLTQKPFG